MNNSLTKCTTYAGRKLAGLFCALALLVIACQSKKNVALDEDAVTLNIDGSSTVYPITSAIVDNYKKVYGNYLINVAVSGTGGGFAKFCLGETPINNASRPISQDEIKSCQANGVDYLSFAVANDGIAIVVNRRNDWVKDLTVDELRKIFGKDSVSRWSEVREGWPDEEISCYGPGEASGTYDYFKEVVLKDENFRSDFVSSENDNLLVTGIQNREFGIGFFGHSYFEQNKSKLKLVAIDSGDGPVLPTIQNIENGGYKLLSRPLFVYVSKAFTIDDNGHRFVRFYLENAAEAARSAGYVPLSKVRYEQQLEQFTTENLNVKVSN